MCVGWKKQPCTNPRNMKAKPRTKAQSKLDELGIDGICALTADCVPMRHIAADIGVSWHALSDYINASDERKEQYARAREAQADKFAEDIIKIADDGTRDTYVDENGNERTDQDVIARSRLRVDARKWLAGKMAPKKYGDKIAAEITGADGGPLEFTAIERKIVHPSD